MNATDTSVDVCIATNRESPFLEEALASVLAQDHSAWRIILVDDGSPSPAFARRAVANIANAVVVRQAASGLPAARNRAIRESDSPLIVFLDDDDVWAPNRLSAQVSAAAAHPASVGIFSGFWYVDADGKRVGSGWPAETVDSELLVSGSAQLPRIVTLMVKRTAYDEISGFNEDYSVGEDLDFILRLAMRGHLVAVSDELVGYRRHGDNMSTGRASDRTEQMRLLVELHARAIRRGDSRMAALLAKNVRRARRSAGESTIYALSEAARRHDWAVAFTELRWGASHEPIGTLRAAGRRLGQRARRTTS